MHFCLRAGAFGTSAFSKQKTKRLAQNHGFSDGFAGLAARKGVFLPEHAEYLPKIWPFECFVLTDHLEEF
jgi:hypothetical protein